MKTLSLHQIKVVLIAMTISRIKVGVLFPVVFIFTLCFYIKIPESIQLLIIIFKLKYYFIILQLVRAVSVIVNYFYIEIFILLFLDEYMQSL
jgi:hypothetical protein